LTNRRAAIAWRQRFAQIGSLGKPVGAVVAAAKVLRVLHASERPLNASEVARAAGMNRGTADNILRTLQAESFVGYDEAPRTYTVSLPFSPGDGFRNYLWAGRTMCVSPIRSQCAKPSPRLA